MTSDIPARAAISRFPADYKRKRGRPHIDWIQTTKQDLNRGGLKWEDLPGVTANRVHWKQLTALCAVAGGSICVMSGDRGVCRGVWWCSTVGERWSLTGELSLSCA